MGKGRFLNQKLGKRVSRKFNLLKSELSGRIPRKPTRSTDFKVPEFSRNTAKDG
jgi:hypothetical protein